MFISLVVILSIFFKNYKSNIDKKQLDPELARAMTYEQFEPGDENVQGTDNVKFSAFFLRDLDGDGYAEKIKGTCKKVGGQDTLYMELNVLTAGKLINGKIEINSENFNLVTSIPKDSEIKNTYISNDTDLIELNEIMNGTQKMIFGLVRSGDYSGTKYSAIKTIDDYSRTNTIVFTGTYVSENGSQTQIRKEIPLIMDWYGTTMADFYIKSDDNTFYDLPDRINEEGETVNLDFTIRPAETKYELMLMENNTSGTIPELNGFAPLEVTCSTSGIDFTYDEETRVFTITKRASVDDQNAITNQAYVSGAYVSSGYARYNIYKIDVKYPLEAYNSLSNDMIELNIPVNTSWKGFNNPNEEFDNPYISNVAERVITATFSKPLLDSPSIDVKIGKLSSTSSGTRFRDSISKTKPIKIYKGVSEQEDDDFYNIEWYAYAGKTDPNNGLILEETSEDLLLDDLSTQESMREFSSYYSIGFNLTNDALEEDGFIKVYDDETNELIVTFTKNGANGSEKWSKYTETRQYKYELPIKKVRVETSSVNLSKYIRVYHTKEIDDAYLTEHYTKDVFDTFSKVKTHLNVEYVGLSILRDTDDTNYTDPFSRTKLELSNDALSTQATEKNEIIKITTTSDPDYDEMGWVDGSFLIKLPDEIVDVVINSVSIDNLNVAITSYQYFENSSGKFIKVITENKTENQEKYTIEIDVDISPDPRLATQRKYVELWASNNEVDDYSSTSADIYDVNDNLNVNENVSKNSASINLIAPNSLLVAQTASEFDEDNSVIVSPQIADVRPQYAVVGGEENTAKVGISLKNNYSRTISEVKVIGVIPFEGNDYVISQKDLGSRFTTTLTSEGIIIPSDLEGLIKVYYSTNENPTQDLSNTNNHWVLKENVSDWTSIKTFMIDFEDYVFPSADSKLFEYKINIPNGVDFNLVSYNEVGVFFSLDTEEGKYRTKTEPNKLGFRIAEKYKLSVEKYQSGKSKLVPGATYLVKRDGDDSGKSAITDENGKIQITNLYAEEIYTLQEISSPDDYELNSNVVKFIAHVSDGGTLTAEKISGNVKEPITVSKQQGEDYEVKIKVEDEAKASLMIVKRGTTLDGLGTVSLKGVRYRIKGEGLPEKGKILTTRNNGEADIKGLTIGKEYTLEEISAEGYYLKQPIVFKIINNNGTFVTEVVSGGEGINSSNIIENNSIPTLRMDIIDEKIPEYTLKINKIKELRDITNSNEPQQEIVKLQGAKFKLFKDDKLLGTYETDANGELTIQGLYQYVESKGVEQTYVLKEVKTPEGYSKVKDIVFNVEQVVEGQGNSATTRLVFKEELGEGQKEKNYTVEGNTVSLTIEDSPSFRLIKTDGETKQPLGNVKFAIYNIDNGTKEARNSKGELVGQKETIDGREYYVVSTDSRGELTIDLPEGLYKAVEVETDEKYDLSNNTYYFGIGETRDGLPGIRCEWIKNLGTYNRDSLSEVEHTVDGDIITVVGFRGNEYTIGNEVYINDGYHDCVLAKHNSDGDLLWSEHIYGNNNDVTISDLCATSDGGFAFVLDSYCSVVYAGDTEIKRNDGVKLVKYNSENQIEWSKSVGYSMSISRLEELSNGNLVICGYYYSGTVDAGSVTLTPPDSYDGFVVEYSSDGDPIWGMKIGGTGTQRVVDVTETLDGGIAFCANTESEELIINDDTLTEDSGKWSIVGKFNEAKELEWLKKISDDTTVTTYGIGHTTEGDILVVGDCYSELRIGEFDLSFKGASDCFLVRLNAMGDIKYATSIAGERQDFSKDVLGTDDGGYIFLFDSWSDINIEEFTLSHANHGGMLIRFNAQNEVDWVYTGNSNVDEFYDVSIRDKEIVVGGKFSYARFQSSGLVVANHDFNDYQIDDESLLFKLVEEEITETVSSEGFSVGGLKEDSITTVSPSLDGGYIVGGSFEGAKLDLGNDIILNGASQTNDTAGIVIKYDGKNNIEWARSIKGTWRAEVISSVATSDGGFVVGCNTNSPFLEIGKTSISKSSGDSGVIIKLDEDGNVQWYVTITGTAKNYINDIIEIADGGIIVTGYYKEGFVSIGESVLQNNGDTDGMIIKVSSEGEVIWTKNYCGNSAENVTAVAETSDGGFITGISYESANVTVEDKNYGNKGYSDTLLVRYNSEGEKIWARNISGGGYDDIRALIETDNGEFIIETMSSSKNLTIDEQYLINNGTSDANGRSIAKFVTTKIDADGNALWARQLLGTTYGDISSITETVEGNYVLVGKTQSKDIALGNGYTITTNGLSYGENGLLVSFSPDGKIISGKLIYSEQQEPYCREEVFDIATLVDGRIVIVGSYTGSFMRLDNNEVINNNGNKDGFVVFVDELASISNQKELEIENYRKEYKITTSIKALNGTKGGTISGEGEVYEIVKHGDNNINTIVMTPEENYEIIAVTLNGKEWPFEPMPDGTYTMPQFMDVKEDKHVEVTFALKNNKITINKVDNITNEPIEGATFKINQIDERNNPDESQILGQLTNSGATYKDVDFENEITGRFGTLTANDTYYFVEKNGKYVPNNSKTWQMENVAGATGGVGASYAKSYIPVDLTDLSGQFRIVLNASVSSEESNDYGAINISEDSNSSGSIFIYRLYGEKDSNNYISGILNGGKTYYIHLSYYKNSSVDSGRDQVEINSIKLYGTRETNLGFEEVDGKFVSTNQKRPSSRANSYIPIDLTGANGTYELTVSAEVSSERDDYGYVSLSNSTSAPEPSTNNIYGIKRLIYINEDTQVNDCKIILEAGKMYYLHFGYNKGAYTDGREDKFTINSVHLSLSGDYLAHATGNTNSDGQFITELPFGKYEIKEIKTKDGYILDTVPVIKDVNGNVISENGIIEFRADENSVHEFKIENEKYAHVTVHHYIKGTTTKLAEDEELEGKAGSNYSTSPKIDLERYELEKNATTGEYILPANAQGQFTNDNIVVNYYYVKKKAKVTVHHYLIDSTTPVPLNSGGAAQDVVMLGNEGATYQTSPIASSQIDNGYKLAETPSNATGTYEFPSVEVIYYYKPITKMYWISKLDYDTHEPLSGVLFEVDGEEYTTSEDGTITLDLGIGQHTIVEKETLDGYYSAEFSDEIVIDKNTPPWQDLNVYNRKIQGTITVHHYIQRLDGTKTTEKVKLADGTEAEDEVRSGYLGDMYASMPKTNLSPTYKLSEVPENSSGEYIDGNIEVNYYYQEQPGKVTVHHYLEGTTTKLADDVVIDGLVGDNYTTGVGNVANKYEVVSIPTNANGIMTPEDIEVTYYYRLKNAQVTVHYYIEGTTTSLAPDVVINGKVDDPYTTSAASGIPTKYQLVAEPSNKNGTMTVAPITVTYYYRLKEAGVDVHYYLLDNRGNETTNRVLHTNGTEVQDVTINGRVDDSYTTSAATNVMSKYRLVRTTNNTSGTMTEDRITVIYYYQAKDTSVLVHHYIEGTTNKVPNKTGGTVQDVVINGKVDDSYTTIEATNKAEYYELVAEPTNKSGTMTEAQTVVIYYYKLKYYPYKVNYLERGSNAVLNPQKQGANRVWGSTVSASSETISIDGYRFVEGNPNTLTITENENILNLYYQKRNDLSYTVRYLEKGTNAVLHAPKTVNNQTYLSTITSSNEVIAIDGYNYDSVDKNTLTITTGTNEIKIYYTKKNDLSYTVRYLEKGTNKVIHDPKTVGNQVYNATITSSNEVISINGYNYDSVDKNTLTIGTGTNEIKIYYTKKNDLSYTVRYLEKGTNKVLHAPKTVYNQTFETVITSSSEIIGINGYNYDSVDKNTLTIGTGTNEIKIYYTKKNDLSYTVRYLEKGTNNVVHEPKTVGNQVFESVITSSNEVIAIDGYNYDSVDKNTLTIGTGTNEIKIFYTKRNDLSYTVNYYEKVGTENVKIHDSKTVPNQVFNTIINTVDEVIDIEGFGYDYSVPGEKLQITTGENVINLFYSRINGLSYKVNYLEEGTDRKIVPTATINDMTFGDVINSSDEVIDIDGYNFVRVDKDTLTIGVDNNTNYINVYYVKKNNLTYTVRYLEKGTGRVLHEPKTVRNQTFETVITSRNEVIPIDGFNFDSVDKETLTITTGDNVITVFYTKKNDLSYTVKYLEKGTGRVLHDPKTVGNQVFETVITSRDEVIPIDGFNFDSVDKEQLTITTGTNEITIWYTKKNDLSYKVNYLEKDTGRVLHDQKTVGNQVFEAVITAQDEVIDIDGFNYDSVDKDTLTITTGDNVINVFYTKRTDLSYTVKYLEKDTGRVLHDPKTVDNQTFETVIISQNEIIDIDGFNYDSVDKDTLSIGTGTNEITIWYTKRTDLSYTVYYLEKDTNEELHSPKTEGNQIFEATINSLEEIIDIDGYKFDSVDKDTLSITTGTNEITVYYTKITTLSYTVKYLEKDTEKVIHEPKTVEGQTFHAVIDSSQEVIDIDGYNYDSVDKDQLTITTGTNEITVFYTKRNDLKYTVNYLEKDSEEVLHDPRVVTNATFEQTVFSADEVIDIHGYNFNSPDKDSIVIGTDETNNIINLYYTKKNDLSYTVYYLEDGTDKEINTPKVVENMTYKDIVDPTDEVIEIYGYNYDHSDPDSLEIDTENNEIRLYYSRKNAKVIVHYLETGTDTKLSEDVTLEGKVYDDYVSSEADDIPSKYVLVREPENARGMYREEDQEVTYYYIKKKTKVIVHHYQDLTETGGLVVALSQDVEIEGRVDDEYETEVATDIPRKFEFTGVIPDNAEGYMQEDTIVVTYYYNTRDSKVTFKYIDIDTGEPIDEPEIQRGKVDETYRSDPKDIDGYTYKETEGEPEGILTVEEIEVTFYYKKNTKVTIKYIDINSNEEIDDNLRIGNRTPMDSFVDSTIIIPGVVGDDYETVVKAFTGYKLVEIPDYIPEKMTRDEITLVYKYVHISEGVIERHIDTITGELLEPEIVHSGDEGDPYKIDPKTFDGYDLVEEKLPGNSQGTFERDPITVTYEYKHKAKVIVKYVDIVTGEELAEEVIIDGHEKDPYTTETKVFEDYKLEEMPNNTTGEMTVEDIVVTYNYRHLSGGIVVNYIDVLTNEQLLDEEKQEGYEGEPYETAPKTIDEYVLVEERYPENDKGLFEIDTIYVNYYYKRKAKVKTVYVDQKTGKEIVYVEEGEEVDTTEEQDGFVGDNYQTLEKEIPGYVLVEVPDNIEGTMQIDDIEVKYIYARKAKVIARYVEDKTGEKLADEEEQEGYDGKEYNTEEKDIRFYELVEEKQPQNNEGTMEANVTIDEETGKEIVDDVTYVDYVYRKKVFNLSIDKKIKQILVNGVPRDINDKIGKAEIRKQEINATTIKVVYTIVVKNDGELKGKAKIVETIPPGMYLDMYNDAEWLVKDGKIVRETEELEPGETKEYDILFNWTMEEYNLGSKLNLVEMEDLENEAGFEELSLKDNSSTAEMILLVGTGKEDVDNKLLEYAAFIALMFSATVCIYYIRKPIKE